jgi:N-acetylglucosamine-6-phosphate deacetylase
MSIVGNALIDGKIATVDLDPATGQTQPRAEDRSAPLLVPGFVDLHIHGGFGVDFMRADAASMTKLCDRLAECGYEGFLPTTVTASAEDVRNTLATLPDHPLILGFHLEGPFISPKYPGAQPQAFIASPGAEGWDDILTDPRLKRITLAPELPGALDMISTLSRRGVMVSMGHTNATYAEAEVGFKAGAWDTTHTYNAMRPLHHREAGTVGFALNEDGLTCELIYDRHHVAKEAAAILVRTKPKDRLVAVSDGTFAIGLPAGQMVRMWGLDCVIGEGQVRLTDGTLAGSAITLLDAFRNLHQDFGAETAIRACALNPRLRLGLNEPPKVWLQFDRDLNLEIIHRA